MKSKQIVHNDSIAIKKMEFESLEGFVSFAPVSENSATTSHFQAEQYKFSLIAHWQTYGYIPPATEPINCLAFPKFPLLYDTIICVIIIFVYCSLVPKIIGYP